MLRCADLTDCHSSCADRPGTDELNDAERSRIAEDLRRLDVGEVRFGRHDRLLYSTDASLYQVEPIGVVTPRDADSAAKVVLYCSARGPGPAAARRRDEPGGPMHEPGSGAGSVAPLPPNPEGRRRGRGSVASSPGISIDELNRSLVLEGTGLFFAPDPATTAQASIGGCIGNNAAAARSVRYGRTSENLSGVEVVLTTGERVWLEAGAGRRSPIARRLAEQVAAVVRDVSDEIRQRFPDLVRRNAGYGLDLILRQLDRGVSADDLDLSGLICGSEGTLALTVAARLKLCPLPKAAGWRSSRFPI